MPDNKRVVAVVVAGGMGQRMKSTTPKQFLLLKGKPVLQWSLECFDKTPEVTGLVLVLPEEWLEEGMKRLQSFKPQKPFKVVPGASFARTRFGPASRLLMLLMAGSQYMMLPALA